MKYNNDILDKIAEMYDTDNHNDLGLENITNGYLEMMKKGSKIHIKPENRGKFNATKKRTGKTTEELTHSKNPITRKRAVFAQNAAR
uniref:Uncharacterized protein n=1 Tax=CrAss-like virus sp. ctYsL76 TaxID=2826826 RepID=A0A8S5QLY9_9CAUD|nr:MAG TPA: hypothetical protein [CrAss-like virus sp. ctYsL76]